MTGFVYTMIYLCVDRFYSLKFSTWAFDKRACLVGAHKKFVYSCRVWIEKEKKRKKRVGAFELWQLHKIHFPCSSFRAIHKYTPNVRSSNKFLIAPLSWERVVCTAAEGLREKPREAAENSYLPFITEEGGRRRREEGKETSKEMRRQECVFFSALLSKERGKLSFLTAVLWNLCSSDWLLMRHSCDRFVQVTRDLHSFGLHSSKEDVQFTKLFGGVIYYMTFWEIHEITFFLRLKLENQYHSHGGVWSTQLQGSVISVASQNDWNQEGKARQ